jgi:hypothetical protein
MLTTTLKNLALTSALIVLTTNTVLAATALSWNLARDMSIDIGSNPSGAWSFMQNPLGNNAPAKFILLPSYSAPCDFSFWNAPIRPQYSCWQNLNDPGIIGVEKGRAFMHPGANNQLVLRWTSPITGKISILGRIGGDNPTPNCGDGIKWYVRTQSNTLIAKLVPPNRQGITFQIQTLSVKTGASLYFIADKIKNTWCDSMDVDILITHQK